MKKTLLSLFMFGMMVTGGCSGKEEFFVREVTQIKHAPSTYYVKVSFEPKHIGKDVILQSINIDNIKLKDAFLIKDQDLNAIKEWEKNKESTLPFEIKEGEKYSVVFVSEDKEIFNSEEIDFDYKMGSKELTYIYYR